MLTYSWLSLLPPVIVVIVGFSIQHLNFALFSGILSAALIAKQAAPFEAFSLIITRLWEQVSALNNIYLYLFLLMISCIVVFLNKGPGPRAFVTKMSKKINNASTVELATVFSSLALSLDDYLSILTVGNVMKHATDRFSISREKLAFYIHGLAGSMVILLPISSWVATITGYLSQSGISPTASTKTVFLADPFFVYLETLPFMFYSFLILGSILFVIALKIPICPNKSIHTTNKTQDNLSSTSQSTFDLFFPLTLLVCLVIIGILYTGNSILFGGTASFIDAFRNNEQIFLILFGASSITLVATIVVGVARKTVSAYKIPAFCFEGYLIMKDAIIMVILASTLGSLLKIDLMTGQYVASIALTGVSISLIPFICFVTSMICTLATGSAWGTFSFMTAIAVPMLSSMYQISTPASPQDIPLFFPVLGAIFSGGICGDHLSPFSETTIMTATSTDIEPLHHSASQFPYAAPAAIGTSVAFLCTGFLSSYTQSIQILVPLITGYTITFILLWILHSRSK